jgi:periplasmic nitrate reductase NapD
VPEAPVPQEVHISSLVIHATPARLQRVEEEVVLMPGAQVHGRSPSGKLVVTLDAGSADEMLERVNQIQRTEGVLSAALVYQYADTVEAMNQEIPDAH